MHRRACFLGAIFIITSALFVGCGSDEDSTGTGTGSGTGTGTGSGTGTGTGVTGGGGSTGGGGAGGGVVGGGGSGGGAGCNPPLLDCNGTCVDPLTDDDHCGGCDPCVNQVCIGGACEDADGTWSDAGTNPLTALAMGHDLTTDGTLPTVAYVQGGAISSEVHVESLDPDWTLLDPSPSQGATFLGSPVAATFDGSAIAVLYSDQGVVHAKLRQGGAWQEVGAPGYSSPCVSHMSLDFTFDGATPHVTTFGAGGCGLGVDYAWWDGGAWQVHPSGNFNDQITMNATGKPAIAFTNQAYVAVAHNDQGTSSHALRYWDVNSWAELSGPLDNNNNSGFEEHMAVVADASGNIYVAWVEADLPAARFVWVQRYDAVAQSWSLVGGSAASVGVDAHDPSIALIGDVPWVAYTETVVGVRRVYVSRIDTTGVWQQIGAELDDDPFVNSYEPVIVGVAGVPFVAYREGAQLGPAELFVKTYP